MVTVLFCLLWVLPSVSGSAMSNDMMREMEIIREEFKAEINYLKGENDDLKVKVNNLISAMTGLKDKKTALRNDVNTLQANKPTYTEYSDHIDPGLGHEDLFPLKGSLVPKRAVDGELVAFHAYMENGKCFQSHEIIVFDHIITNTVAAYDNSDGIFTAPTTGIYVFIWNFSSSTSSLNVMELVVHGVVVGASMSDSEHSTDYHPAAGFAIIHVNAGERVFVRKTRQAGHSCVIVSSFSYIKTTFSGWLLS